MEKNAVCVYKDDIYSIFLCKDNYKGASIQVCMKIDKLSPNPSGEMVKHKTEMVVHQDRVPVNLEGKSRNQKFEEHVSDSIRFAKEKVSELKSNDKVIDDVLDAHREANKKLNESESKSS